MKIKIKNYDWEIVEVDDNYEKFFDENGDLILYGSTDYRNQIIRIYKNANYQRKHDTILHELTHAFLDVYLNAQSVRDVYNDEDVCCFIETYIDDILEIANNFEKHIELKSKM